MSNASTLKAESMPNNGSALSAKRKLNPEEIEEERKRKLEEERKWEEERKPFLIAERKRQIELKQREEINEEKKRMVMNNRAKSGQCIMCGHRLSFFQKVFGKNRHKRCASYKE